MSESLPIFESILKNSHDSNHSSLLLNFKNVAQNEEFKQIDLNDEKNLSELEDPILVNHMLESRKKLEDYKKLYESKEIVKNKEDIDNEILDNSKLSASCILSLNENNILFSNNIEYIILQNANLLKLYNEENPHGFPPVENFSKINNTLFKKIINHLTKKISTPLDNIILASNNLIELEKKMKNVINHYELLIGKLFTFNQLILAKNEELITSVAELSLKLDDAATEDDAAAEDVATAEDV